MATAATTAPTLLDTLGQILGPNLSTDEAERRFAATDVHAGARGMVGGRGAALSPTQAAQLVSLAHRDHRDGGPEHPRRQPRDLLEARRVGGAEQLGGLQLGELDGV